METILENIGESNVKLSTLNVQFMSYDDPELSTSNTKKCTRVRVSPKLDIVNIMERDRTIKLHLLSRVRLNMQLHLLQKFFRLYIYIHFSVQIWPNVMFIFWFETYL